MKHLWAPWRMDYILEKDSEGCILCKKVAENSDRKNLVLHRGCYCFIIMNKFPYNNGHLMIAPFRHVGSFEELKKREILELMNLLKESLLNLKKALNPDGFNVGMNLGKVAGAGIEDHIHIHVVPRWNGDTNFMPILASTKVMPDYLENTYELLKGYF